MRVLARRALYALCLYPSSLVMDMICVCTLLCICMPVHVFPLCVCVCMPAGAACSTVCLYIPAHSMCPALRHCAQLHLRPRNVLSSSSSSSQHPSHSSPTPSAGQRAPPHSPGQADLLGVWVEWTHLHSPGPGQGQEVGKEYITVKCEEEQRRSGASEPSLPFLQRSLKEVQHTVKPCREISALFQ